MNLSDNLNGLLSPFLRSKRIKAALPYLKGSVLDYGCGIGTLCAFVPQRNFVGVDIDSNVLKYAQSNYPQAKFYTVTQFDKLPELRFDTVVGLAVIEHVANPMMLLKRFSKRLNPGGQIVLTTPYPTYEWVLHLGATLKLFSKSSHEEHKMLLDYDLVARLGKQANLRISLYRRFLLGANQLIIYQL